MARSFTIPTIFTAIDKFTGPIKAMGRGVKDFASNAESHIARGERNFRKLTPALTHAQHELMQMASAAVIADGAFEAIHFSYESAERYEKAINKLRASSGANSDQLEEYETQIKSVAEATKKGASDIAEAFQIVGAESPELYKNAEALGAVTRATVILSQATQNDLGKSAHDVSDIMDAFNIKAEDSGKTVNALVAIMDKGGLSYDQLNGAIAGIGETARAAKLGLEQTGAAIAVINKTTNLGEASGAAFQKIIVKLEKAHVGYKNGVFDLDRALESVNKKMSKMTDKQKDAYINSLGLKGATVDAARALFAGKDAYDELSKSVTGTTAAETKAGIMTDNITGAFERLKAKWDRMLNSSNKVGSSLHYMKSALEFVTDHMELLVKVGGALIGFFVAWWTLLKLARIGMIAYNIVIGINAALTGTMTGAVMASNIALGAFKAITTVVTAAQWLWNAAMLANPIGLIIIGIVALIALITVIIYKWNEWGAALSLFLGPLGMVISLIQSFRRNWEMIKQAFTEGGILSGIKAIGKTIIDAILMPLQQLLAIVAKVSGWDWAGDAAKNIEKFRADLGVNVTTDEGGHPLNEKKAINGKADNNESIIQQMISKVTQQKVELTVKADPGTEVRGDGGLFSALPMLGSTMKANVGG